MCHGVSAGGFNGDVSSFSAYLPGSSPNVRDSYAFLAHASSLGYDSPQGAVMNTAVGAVLAIAPELIFARVAAVAPVGLEVGAMGKGVFYNGSIVAHAPIEAVTSHEVLAGALVRTAPAAGTPGTLAPSLAAGSAGGGDSTEHDTI